MNYNKNRYVVTIECQTFNDWVEVQEAIKEQFSNLQSYKENKLMLFVSSHKDITPELGTVIKT